MKLKQIIILGLIVSVLGAVLIIKNNRKIEEVQEQEYSSLDFLSSLGEVCRLTIYKGSSSQSQPLILKKAGDKWAAESFYNVGVKKERIDPVLEIFKTSHVELRSSSDSNLADFWIDDEKGLHVEAIDSGNQHLHFIVGLKRAGDSAGFIREKGSAKTYLVDANILSKFGIWDEAEEAKLSPAFFYDLRLLDFNEEKAVYLSINRTAAGLAAADVYSSVDESGSKKWAFRRGGLPFDLDAAKVKKFLKDIVKKSGSEIKAAEENVDYGFSNPGWELIVGIEDVPLRLIKGKFINEEVKNQVYMQVGPAPVAYIVSEDVFKSIDKDDSYFFIDNPLRVNEEKLESITIYEKKNVRRFVCEESADGRKWVLSGSKEPLADDKAKSMMEAVKKFKAEHLLFDIKEIAQKSDSGFSVKAKDKEEIFIDIFPPIEKHGIKIYPVLKRGTSVYFAISEEVYQDIFRKT